jgi:hypothetical protein
MRVCSAWLNYFAKQICSVFATPCLGVLFGAPIMRCSTAQSVNRKMAGNNYMSVHMQIAMLMGLLRSGMTVGAFAEAADALTAKAGHDQESAQRIAKAAKMHQSRFSLATANVLRAVGWRMPA